MTLQEGSGRHSGWHRLLGCRERHTVPTLELNVSGSGRRMRGESVTVASVRRATRPHEPMGSCCWRLASCRTGATVLLVCPRLEDPAEDKAHASRKCSSARRQRELRRQQQTSARLGHLGRTPSASTTLRMTSPWAPPMACLCSSTPGGPSTTSPTLSSITVWKRRPNDTEGREAARAQTIDVNGGVLKRKYCDG